MQWQSSYTSLKPEIFPASAGTFYPVYHHFPTSTDCRYPVVDVTHAPSPLEETHLQVIPVSQANWPPSAIALDRSKALTRPQLLCHPQICLEGTLRLLSDISRELIHPQRLGPLHQFLQTNFTSQL
jgi:hypothetical protein